MGGTSGPGAPGAGGVRSPCSWKWGLHSKVVAHGRSLRWAQGALQSLQGPNQAHGSVAARAQVSADPCLLGPSSAYWPPRHSSGLTGTTQRPSIFGASEHEPHRSPSGLFIEPQALVVSGALTPGGLALHSEAIAHGRSLMWAQGASLPLQGPDQGRPSVAARVQESVGQMP